MARQKTVTAPKPLPTKKVKLNADNRVLKPGNQGKFHGEQLLFLEGKVERYLSAGKSRSTGEFLRDVYREFWQRFPLPTTLPTTDVGSTAPSPPAAILGPSHSIPAISSDPSTQSTPAVSSDPSAVTAASEIATEESSDKTEHVEPQPTEVTDREPTVPGEAADECVQAAESSNTACAGPDADEGDRALAAKEEEKEKLVINRVSRMHDH